MHGANALLHAQQHCVRVGLQAGAADLQSGAAQAHLPAQQTQDRQQPPGSTSQQTSGGRAPALVAQALSDGAADIGQLPLPAEPGPSSMDSSALAAEHGSAPPRVPPAELLRHEPVSGERQPAAPGAADPAAMQLGPANAPAPAHDQQVGLAACCCSCCRGCCFCAFVRGPCRMQGPAGPEAGGSRLTPVSPPAELGGWRAAGLHGLAAQQRVQQICIGAALHGRAA